MQGRIKNCVHLRSIVAGEVEAGWVNDEAKSLCKEISMGKYCRGRNSLLATRDTQAEASSQALRVAPGGGVVSVVNSLRSAC